MCVFVYTIRSLMKEHRGKCIWSEDPLGKEVSEELM